MIQGASLQLFIGLYWQFVASLRNVDRYKEKYTG
jgi:hypothetical protein